VIVVSTSKFIIFICEKRVSETKKKRDDKKKFFHLMSILDFCQRTGLGAGLIFNACLPERRAD